MATYTDNKTGATYQTGQFVPGIGLIGANGIATQGTTLAQAPVMAPSVVSSAAAQDNLNTIKGVHADVTTGMQNQAALMAQQKAQNDAKAAQDAQAQLAAQKQAQDYQIKLSALSEGSTPPPTRTVNDSQGRAYQVDQNGQITSGPSGGAYQVGGNISQYPELATQLNPTTSTGDVNLDRINSSSNAAMALDAERVAQAKKVSDQLLGIQNGTIPLSPAEQSQITSLQAQYQKLIDEQIQTNKAEKGINQLAGYRTGGAAQEYTPEIESGRIADIVTKGTAKVADLQGKMTAAVAELTQALKDNDIEAIQKSYDVYNDAAKDHAKTLQDTISNAQAAIKEQNDAIQKKRDAEALVKKELDNDLQDIADTMRNNGATPELVAQALDSGSVSDAVKIGGVYTAGGTGIVGEYNRYVASATSKGQTPVDFNTYSDLDANRKRSVTVNQYGGYDSSQQKAIDQINTSVSNNASYKKYVSMQTYAANVEAGLAQGSGIGDIAAINQFQKVIDEGAVTRDQDVKLIQSSQSLADTLATKINKLKSGQQLSQEQRNQMNSLTQKMLDTQKKALEKDPSIIAQKKKAERYQVDLSETSLGELDNFGATGNEIIQSEEEATKKLDELYQTHASEIDNAQTKYPNYTDLEIVQILGY